MNRWRSWSNRSAGVNGTGMAVAAAALLCMLMPLQDARATPAASAARIAGADRASAGAAWLTEVGARRGHVRRAYRYRDADRFTFMGLALGAVGTAIADEHRHDYYRQNYFYGGTPYYGRSDYGGPAYYGGPYYPYYYGYYGYYGGYWGLYGY